MAPLQLQLPQNCTLGDILHCTIKGNVLNMFFFYKTQVISDCPVVTSVNFQY